MAKVLFVNPVIRQNDKPTHIPYGMAQLAAITLKEGHLLQVFDANAWRPTDEVLCDVLAADDWDVIATGGLVTTYGFIKKIVKYARKVSPKSLIVLGGGVITPIPHEIMALLPEIDIGVIGEAYGSWPEILKSIDSRDCSWKEIKGIVFRNRSGDVHMTEGRPLLEEIDSIPFPAWDLFPLDIYFSNSSLLLSEEAMLAKRHLGVMASYGCPYKCKYCFHLGLSGELEVSESGGRRRIVTTDKRRIRHHSPAYMIDMITDVKKRFGIDFISFLDENFIFLAKKKTWFDEFSRLWLQNNLQPACAKESKSHSPDECSGIHWGTTAHPALVNPDILERIKRLGCAHLDYGLESFSDDILKSIGKGSTARLNEDAIRMTLQAGIRPIPNQIIGFPDESFQSLKANLEAWRNLGIQSYPFFATPYPGSEWFNTYRDRILEQYDGNLEKFLLDLGDATKITAVISKHFNAVELLGLRELMVNRDLRRIEQYEKALQK